MGIPKERFKRDEETINTIGLNIRKYRKLKGLSQKSLAYLCEITPPMMSKYERGEIDLTSTYLKLISRHLEIHPGQLFDPEE